MSIFSKKLNTLFDIWEARKFRIQKLCAQLTWHVANVNYAHDMNFLNPSNSVTKISMVVMFVFKKCTTQHSNRSHEIFLICRVIAEGCINLSQFNIREPLNNQLHDMVDLINSESKVGFCYPKIKTFQNINPLCLDLESVWKNWFEFF